MHTPILIVVSQEVTALGMIRRSLLVLLLVLAFATCNTAFAQLTCNILSTPVSRSTRTGLTQPAGDITFACTAGNLPTSTATVTINYGLPITNSTSYPAGQPIAVFPGGSFAVTPPTIASISSGVITLNIPSQASPSSGSFTLAGVVLDVSSAPQLTSEIASVSVSPGSNVLITAGQNNPTLITTILDGLQAPKLTTGATPGNLSANGTVTSSSWSVDIQENYIDMFRSAAYFNSPGNGVGSTNATRVELRFTGIPIGITLGGCSVTAIANGNPSPGAPFIIGGSSTITSAANIVDIDWAGDPSLVLIETLRFGCTSITVGPNTTLPITPGNIGVQATLSPIGSAFGNDGSILTSPEAGQIPRYIVSLLPVTPLSVVTITGVVLTVNKQGIGQGTVKSNTGLICGAQCSLESPLNAKVTLTATPDSNSVFAGWSGDCPGIGIPLGACGLVMDNAKSVTATFNPANLTLSSINPTTAPAGSTVGVTFSGFNFINGQTTISVSGAGISVSAVRIWSSTLLSAIFTIAPNADLGGHMVALSTPGQTSSFIFFSVTSAGTPSPVTCVLTSTPVVHAASTGHTEPVGDVTLNCTANTSTTLSSSVVFIEFGVPITNAFSYPATAPIRTVNKTGFFSSANAAGVSNIGGQVQLLLPSAMVNTNDTASITLRGVLVSLAGSGQTSLSATAWTTPGTAYSMTPGLNVATVMNQILPGLTDPAISIPAGGTAGLQANGIVNDPTFGFTIAENYVDMFRSAAQYNSGASTNGTQVVLTFSDIPSGVAISGCSVAAVANGVSSPGSPFIIGATSITSSSNSIAIDWAGPTDLTAIEILTFKCTSISTDATAALPFVPGNVAVTATLAPVGAALGPIGDFLTGPNNGQIPRYALTPLPTTPLPVITIVPAPDGFFTLTVKKAGTGQGSVTGATGIDCGAAVCSVYVPGNSQVTLTATPDATASFTGWNEACAGTGTCVLTMDTPKTVTANFIAHLTLTSISPNNAPATSSVPVTLTGLAFTNGVTDIQVSGTGVTVSSVWAVNSTSLSAVFTIAADAQLGDRNVTVVGAGETGGPVTFTITATEASPPAITCLPASSPVARATSTGLTEVAGDLTFNCTANASTTSPQTLLTVSFGLPITNSVVYPVSPFARPIGLFNPTGFFSSSPPVIEAINNAAGQIQLLLPEVTPLSVGDTGSFSLTGVLVAPSGGGKSSLSATASMGPGSNYFIPPDQNSAVVITQILSGLSDLIISGAAGGTATFANTLISDPSFGFTIAESYIDMFRSSSQYNFGASTNGTEVRLTFTGIPSGVTISGCSATASNGSPFSFSSSITSTANTVIIDWGATPSLFGIETLTFKCTNITVSSTLAIPFAAGNITVQASLAPTGTALSSNGTVLTSITLGQIPRYTNVPSPPLPVIAILPGLPVITAVSTPSVAQASIVSVLLTGAGFTGATSVGVSGTGVTAAIEAGGTDTLLPITLTILPNAAPGLRDIIVTTPVGESGPFSGFTVIGPVSARRRAQLTSQD